MGAWQHGLQKLQARMVRALLACGGNPSLQVGRVVWQAAALQPFSSAA